jgi:hypothetical protein
MLLTKSLHWQYEKEWRMFESAFNADDNIETAKDVWGFDFHPETVDRVILGSRIASDIQTRIMKELDKPEFQHVTILGAALSPDEFEIKHTLIRERKRS